MKEVFIIFACHNDYEAVPYPIDFKLTEKEAKEEVKKLGAFEEEADRLRSVIMAPSWGEMMADSEKPVIKDIPKWPAGTGEKDITTEMRSERDRIKYENNLARQEFGRIYKERRKAKTEECINVVNSLDVSDEMKARIIKGNVIGDIFTYQKVTKK